MAKKISLEESFQKLETIITEMEDGDMTLEDSFKKYEEGMKLIKNCSDSIDRVEKKLIVLENGGEEPKEG
ncbi:MAG: exodeoxyribonuclease VII small subunit [Lachnospiraceae bacterium]|nr:exodeoxyribonuclease VII small subunit [Lachnospiraceae bacterium]